MWTVSDSVILLLLRQWQQFDQMKRVRNVLLGRNATSSNSRKLRGTCVKKKWIIWARQFLRSRRVSAQKQSPSSESCDIQTNPARLPSMLCSRRFRSSIGDRPVLRWRFGCPSCRCSFLIAPIYCVLLLTSYPLGDTDRARVSSRCPRPWLRVCVCVFFLFFWVEFRHSIAHYESWSIILHTNLTSVKPIMNGKQPQTRKHAGINKL